MHPMDRLKSFRALLVGVVILVVALAATLGTVLALPTSAASPTAASPNATYTSHPVSVNPQLRPAGDPTNAVFSCQTDRGPDAIVCYSPQQIQQAYGINSLLSSGINGKGHTIVIIDAFQNPTMQSDLAAFDSTFGLPAPQFVQVAPQGLTPFDPNDDNMVGWAGEIALDVQWAHAIAPAAKIELVLAKSNQDVDILNATKWAVDHNVGDVISQSFGENENCVDRKLLKVEHDVYQEATRKGITLFASSGDEGAAEQTCDGTSWVQVASSPASDPLVTAVGATELFAAFDCSTASPCASGSPTPGTYDHEITLNEPAGEFTEGNFSTGGGFSDLYSRPNYQNGFTGHNKGRGVPDVAYSGSINHGVLASCGACAGVSDPAFFIFGGTSAGSPQWAGLIALADQLAGHRLGFINDNLYDLSRNASFYAVSFRDITDGNNTVQEPNSDDVLVTVQGFNATKGWDAATGLGTPQVPTLIPLLAKLGGSSSPHY
jgi:subtilase family serine protease